MPTTCKGAQFKNFQLQIMDRMFCIISDCLCVSISCAQWAMLRPSGSVSIECTIMASKPLINRPREGHCAATSAAAKTGTNIHIRANLITLCWYKTCSFEHQAHQILMKGVTGLMLWTIQGLDGGLDMGRPWVRGGLGRPDDQLDYLDLEHQKKWHL